MLSFAAASCPAAAGFVGGAGNAQFLATHNSLSKVRMQMIPDRAESCEVVVAGGTTANVLFGKLQRAAQLPSTRLNPAPIAAVENRGALSSMLWSSFAMSNVPSSDWMEPAKLPTTMALAGGMLFLDKTTSADKGGFQLPNPFAKKAAEAAPGAVDVSLLEAAGARGARHCFLLVEASQVGDCVRAVESLSSCPPTTIIAPGDGVTLESSKGWVQKPIQDHEGVLIGGIGVQSGYSVNVDEDGAVTTSVLPTSGPAGALPREDFAELAVQCALRLSHTADEGAPKLRVVRAFPSGDSTERPFVNYDTIIGGPKFRASQGTVNSADWSTLLAPFGVVKKSDPEDWRLLVDA